jgi:hypothetical protein
MSTIAEKHDFTNARAVGFCPKGMIVSNGTEEKPYILGF